MSISSQVLCQAEISDYPSAQIFSVAALILFFFLQIFFLAVCDSKVIEASMSQLCLTPKKGEELKKKAFSSNIDSNICVNVY